MAQVPNTDTIIKVAKISQYLYNRAIYGAKFYNSQPLDERKPELLYVIRKDVEWIFETNPSDPSLPFTGEYLFGLCAPFTQQALQIVNNSTQSAPILSGPQNISVTVGQNAIFQVSVISSLPVTYQWFLNGVLIPNAISCSYTKLNAQLSDDGGLYSVRVTNSAGSVLSTSAQLTVTAALIGFLYYSDSDPYPAIQAHVDNFVYQNTFPIIHNSPFSIPIPTLATPSKYLLIKVPIGESVKNKWTNTSFNFGDIPDSVWQVIQQFGGFTFYTTRDTVTMDPTSNLTMYVG